MDDEVVFPLHCVVIMKSRGCEVVGEFSVSFVLFQRRRVAGPWTRGDDSRGEHQAR